MKLKNLKLETLVYNFFSLLFIFSMVIGIFSTLTFRQLTNDGIRMALNVLSYGTFNIEFPYLRFSTLILQIPAVITFKIFNNPYSTLWVLCFSYFIYPFILYLTIKAISRNENIKKFQLLFFAIFFIAILPSSAFSLSCVNEAICIYLFIYVYIINKLKLNFLIISITAILLLFSYELSLVFYPLIAYILYREKKGEKKSYFLLLTCFLLQVLNLLTRIIPLNKHSSYIFSVKNNLFTWQSANALFYLLSLIILLKAEKTYIRILIFSLASFLILLQFSMPEYFYLNWQAYGDRVWAIPFVFIFTIIFYEFIYKKNKSINISIIFITFIFSLTIIFKEMVHSYSHYKFFHRLEREIIKTKGCIKISDEKLSYLFQGPQVNDNSLLPLWSIIIQRTLNPNVILLSTLNLTKKNNINFLCQIDKNNLCFSNQNANMCFPTNRKINYRNVTTN